MSRVFWDTNLFIYHIEGKGRHFEAVGQLLARMNSRGDELLTSTLTLGEVLAGPIAKGDTDLANQFVSFFESSPVRLVPFDKPAALIYAEIRKDRSIRPPDTIQLACAGAAKANLFITNDERLTRKTAPGIDFILPLERAIF